MIHARGNLFSLNFLLIAKLLNKFHQIRMFFITRKSNKRNFSLGFPRISNLFIPESIWNLCASLSMGSHCKWQKNIFCKSFFFIKVFGTEKITVILHVSHYKDFIFYQLEYFLLKSFLFFSFFTWKLNQNLFVLISSNRYWHTITPTNKIIIIHNHIAHVLLLLSPTHNQSLVCDVD